MFASVSLACTSTSCFASSERGPVHHRRPELVLLGERERVTWFHRGVAKDCTVPAQVVAPGGGVGTHNGCQWYGSEMLSQVFTGV